MPTNKSDVKKIKQSLYFENKKTDKAKVDFLDKKFVYRITREEIKKAERRKK